MKYALLNRRQFMLSASLVLAGAVAPRGAAWLTWADDPGPARPDFDQLLSLARTLFPHASFPDKVYEDVLKASVTTLAPQLDAAAAALDQAAGGKWKTLDGAARIDILSQLESAGWFGPIRDAVRAGLYLGAPFYALIGYEGSSKEYGGYLGRGAGEIDWLPGGQS
jgi:hypothetical protein